MIDNAAIRRYNTTLQYYPTILTKSPCDWRRAIFLQAGPASAQLRLDFIPHPFSLPAGGLTNRLPRDEPRERQDYPFGLTGETPLALLPPLPNSLNQCNHLTCGRRQAP